MFEITVCVCVYAPLLFSGERGTAKNAWRVWLTPLPMSLKTRRLFLLCFPLNIYSRLKVQRTANVHKLAKMNSNFEVFCRFYIWGRTCQAKITSFSPSNWKTNNISFISRILNVTQIVFPKNVCPKIATSKNLASWRLSRGKKGKSRCIFFLLRFYFWVIRGRHHDDKSLAWGKGEKNPPPPTWPA